MSKVPVRCACTLDEARRIAQDIGFPVRLLPAFSLRDHRETVEAEGEFEAAFIQTQHWSPTAEVGIEKA